ncbi:hypothetical protein [Halarchaeum nitratireducens]|uniref:Uncharacterized protein n=1 Tax=Halarchaeum nitratireducens TaxID=489913 RepID=A0A830GC93_9EURY|nr:MULTISPECIES: hypothetical protein [Halarchaeum]MBP2252090.1 hypothetical protein [Halarchaeum solikamskense]GGN16861.1 hypothetical protein GCM10009021_16940 [Halarchaeum nitratireducens]
MPALRGRGSPEDVAEASEPTADALGAFRHDDGALRALRDGFGDRAEEELLDGTLARRAEDREVGVRRRIDDGVRDVRALKQRRLDSDVVVENDATRIGAVGALA